MGKRGQPRTSLFIRYNIAYKVIQYKKRFNITPYKAWLKLTEHRGFNDLMLEHFKNKSGGANWWANNIRRPDVKKNFFKNHIVKIIKEFSHLKIYTPKEYKDYLASKRMGIVSLKKSIKKTRRS